MAVPVIGAQRPDSSGARQRASQARRDSALVRADSIKAARDSVAAAHRRARVIPVTPDMMATAFQNDAAHTLLDRARRARMQQDSALRAYDANLYERFSVGLRLGSLGYERLLFRAERTAHVQWARNVGAYVDLTGRRTVVPLIPGMGTADVDVGPVPVPYVPGQDALWVGVKLAKANVTDTDLLNPLANGAEAYYTYHLGDSVAFQLPGGTRIVVRELRVRPRTPRWDAVVGSLWFDVQSGQLVRAVYRLSAPMDIVKKSKDDGEDVAKEIPVLLRPVFLPMHAQIDVMTVEYGLFEGRFWLPNSQTAEGSATIGVMHAPISLQQRFDYRAVNGDLSLTPIQLQPIDTLHTVAALEQRRAVRDSACKDTANAWTRTQSRFDNTVLVATRVPCDTLALLHSSTLPPSAYSNIDTLFASTDRDALIQRTLGLGAQAGAGRQPPSVVSGLRAMRYNRVEGLSLGASLTGALGEGYTSQTQLRIGTADGSITGALSLARSNGRHTNTLTAYRRLAAANDWHDPFTLSASLSAVLFGRDQGLYYRTWGAELVSQQDDALLGSWRLFGERETGVRIHSTFSLPHAIRGDKFTFHPNIDADRATEFGLAVRRQGTVGENPRGARLTTDFRAEGATGTFDYVRGMIDFTLAHPIAGPLAGALTLSGGMSGGTLPVQRLWYLGGERTLAGQPVGVLAGNAYWLTRLEVAAGNVAFRPVFFGDLGWAGDRTKLHEHVRPASSAGVGWSMLGGLVRFDLARGIRPERGVRGYLYLDARF